MCMAVANSGSHCAVLNTERRYDMRCIPVEELNYLAQSPDTLVQEAENAYADQISAAAERIYEERSRKPVVLISGPSGSGNTTTAHRIAQLLKDNGCRAHTISRDS